MDKPKSYLTAVMKVLEIEKINWPQVMKGCKDALKQGFSGDDFVHAAEAMKAGDTQYQSVMSVFTRTDYWLNQYKKMQEDRISQKGVWL